MRTLAASGLRIRLGIGLGVALSLATCSLSLADGGSSKSVTGHLRDSFCYAVMGAQGASHQKCAIGCAKAGIPVLMVENGTDKSYVLIPPKNDEALPAGVIDKMEDEVTITGNVFEKGGTNFLQVESVK
jgi:hypothetical protein